MTRVLVLLLLSSLSGVLRAQEQATSQPAVSDYQWVTKPLDRVLPTTADEARRLRVVIDADRQLASSRDYPEETKKALIKALDGQYEALGGMLSRLQKIQDLPEEISKTENQIEDLSRRKADLAQELTRTGEDVTKWELAKLESTLAERRTDLATKVAELDRLTREEIPTAQQTWRDRNEQIAILEANVATMRKDRIEAENEARRLQSAAVDDFRILVAVEFAVSVRMAEARHKAQADFIKKRAEKLLELRINEVEAQVEVTDLEVKLLRRQVDALQKDLERRQVEERTRQQGIKTFWIDYRKSAPKVSHPYIDVNISVFEQREALAEWQRKEAEWTKRLGLEGRFGLAKAETDDLRDKLKREEVDPSDDNLPGSAEDLKVIVEDARARSEFLAGLRNEFHLFEISVRDAMRRSQKELQDLPTRIAAERARERQLQEGTASTEIPAEEAWTRVSQDLTTATKALASNLERLRGDLRKKAAEVEPVVTSAREVLTTLERRLLWTREESDITVAALQRAVDDTAAFVRGENNYLVSKAKAFWAFQTDPSNRRTVIASWIVLLVFLLGLSVIRRKMPDTCTWLEMRGGTRSNKFFRIVAMVLRQTQLTFAIALIFAGAPAILGLPWDILAPMVIIFVTPFLYRILKVLLDLFLDPDAPETRLVRADPELVRMLYRAGLFPLGISAFVLPVCLLFESSDYRISNPGFVELVWLVYKALLNVSLMVTLFRPAVIRHLIRGSGELATSVKTGILLIYPVVVGAVLTLFVLDSLRYVEAATYFRLLALESVGLLLGTYVVYRLVLRGVLPGKDFSAKLSPDDYPEQSAFLAAGRDRFFSRLIRFGLGLLFFVPAIFIVTRLWPESIGLFMARPISGSEGGVTPRDLLVSGLVVWATFALHGHYRDGMRFVVLPNSKLEQGLKYTILTLSSYSIIIFGTVVALNILNVKGDQIAWFVSALAVGIGFGLQSIVKNFVSGLILLIERPVEVGDVINVDGKVGQVHHITMRATTVMTADGVGVVVPNEQMIGSTLVNWSYGAPKLRTCLAVGVAYGSDTQLVRKVLLEAASSHGLVMKRPVLEVLFMGFGDSSLNFEVRYWTSIENRLRVESDVRFAIDAAFRRHEIEIPFPQRDLHVRSIDPAILESLTAKEPRTDVTTAGVDPDIV